MIQTAGEFPTNPGMRPTHSGFSGKGLPEINSTIPASERRVADMAFRVPAHPVWNGLWLQAILGPTCPENQLSKDVTSLC
jgi:hypothetical protein